MYELLLCDVSNLDVEDDLAPGDAEAVEVQRDMLWIIVNVCELEDYEVREEKQCNTL